MQTKIYVYNEYFLSWKIFKECKGKHKKSIIIINFMEHPEIKLP